MGIRKLKIHAVNLLRYRFSGEIRVARERIRAKGDKKRAVKNSFLVGVKHCTLPRETKIAFLSLYEKHA